jgi:hypothetical protein
MRKSITTIRTRTIPGFLALSIVLGLFAGCADILSEPPAELTEGRPAAGTGRVLIRLSNQAKGARTFMPVNVDYSNFSYTYTFTSEGKLPVSGAISEESAVAELGAGTWALTVYGADSGNDSRILKGTVTDIEVSIGTSTPVNVRMKWDEEAGDGSLNYSVSFPDTVSTGTLTVYGVDNDEKQVTPVDLAAGTDTNNDPAIKTVSGTITLPAGQYRVALDLYKADGVLSRTDIAHIYPDLTTEAPYTIAAADFVPATVDSTQTSLAGVLQSISTLASGANVTYVLPAGDETMSATSVSCSNPVTVTIDGGGRVVTLASDGSLITVGAHVTLVLKNVTLKGRGSDTNNSKALVSVASGGTLETGTGLLITANRLSSSSSYYGGGVYVDSNGTFTMSGGEIAGNTAYRYGGGVYVDSNGTFTMSGGEIAGNTASSSYSSSYGGGVYVSGGTFTMSGGEIAGNTASSSSSSYGGGVYVASNGTFTMSGGEIAGNTASSSSSSSYGGGVYVAFNGTFTMSGGEIAGNTASASSDSSFSSPSSYGGGVYVDYGTFTMSGGEIAGNTASSSSDSSYGGGVYVDYGTFTMSDGEIAGNTASSSSSSSYGGGVYVDYGTFTMSGGEIAGNTASSSYSSYGGGVYFSGGTFTKSGQSTIYGSDASAALKNTAKGGNGHAVYASSAKMRNTTAGPDVDLNSAWADISTPPIPVTGITYDDVWELQGDGRRKSPAISHNNVSKARVSFTATDNAIIVIQLDVSSESGFDYAFISQLNNGAASSSSGYYTGSRISGTQSVTITILVPTAGSYFVDIGYEKDNSSSIDSDCAWFKVIEWAAGTHPPRPQFYAPRGGVLKISL